MKKPTNTEMISISKIIPDENQPRKYFDAKKIQTLRASIKRDGILNPLIVEAVKGEKGKYRIIDGERRYRAALEEGLKEVPYIVLDTQNEVDRLLQQFQIQELHEGWTPVEKAMALERLAKEMKMTIPEVCKLVGVHSETARRYNAFSAIVDKKLYVQNETPLEFAMPINSLKTVVKKLYHDMDKAFERSDEKLIEAATIIRIKDGTIKKTGDIIKVKDSLTKNPKWIQKYIETDVSPEKMFIETKAKGAFHLRNVVNHAGYLQTHINKFLETSDVKLDSIAITQLKSVDIAIGKILSLAK